MAWNFPGGEGGNSTSGALAIQMTAATSTIPAEIKNVGAPSSQQVEPRHRENHESRAELDGTAEKSLCHMQPRARRRFVNVARAAHKADAGSHAGENLAKKQLPVGPGGRHQEIPRRHPEQCDEKHAPGAEPVDKIPAGNLHAGVSQENAGRQKPCQGVVEAELAHQRGRQRRVIGVVGGIRERDDAAANYGRSLRLFG